MIGVHLIDEALSLRDKRYTRIINLIVIMILFDFMAIIHETGHYIAAILLGYDAVIVSKRHYLITRVNVVNPLHLLIIITFGNLLGIVGFYLITRSKLSFLYISIGDMEIILSLLINHALHSPFLI